MLNNNPFAALTFPPIFMQAYFIVMALAVVAGTLFDVYHKGSAKFFALRSQRAQAAAQRRLGAGQMFLLAITTVAEAAVSGEFCKWPRRLSHLLMMYGFLTYVITTAVMIFAYPAGVPAPNVLSSLWVFGAFMILVGGLWFFFFLRVDVAHDGASPFHLGRADLFVGSLLASTAFALAWGYAQTSVGDGTLSRTLFGVYIFFTTLLFVSVPWSKFAHMFFKPAVAFQRRIEEANGSSDLPSPAAASYIVRS